jgi:type IV pilus assembly protein PilB
MYAIKDGASDIHIEPQRKGVRIRYRIDGVLHEQMKVPQYVLNPLVSRIKIMGDMNIAERRIPQDGRIHIKMQDRDYDLRVSTLPTSFGEKVVMRILDKSSVLIGLDKLGRYQHH